MQDWIDLLLKYDDENKDETPAYFTREYCIDAYHRLRKIKEELKQELDIDFTHKPGSIQDASYFDWLFILSQAKDNRYLVEIGLYFSYFGNFVMIWGERTENYPVLKIIDILTKNNFIFIPQTALETKYCGRHPRAIEVNCTWAERYFSFINWDVMKLVKEKRENS